MNYLNHADLDRWITRTPEDDPHDDLDLAAHEALLADFAEQDASQCEGWGCVDGCVDCDPRARPLPMDGSDYHVFGEC